MQRHLSSTGFASFLSPPRNFTFEDCTVKQASHLQLMDKPPTLRVFFLVLNMVHHPELFGSEQFFFNIWQSAGQLGCHRILEIVITLVKANKTAMSHLYKLGAFEILLWKLLAGDIVDWDKSRIAEFLSQSHLLQVISTVLFLEICFNQCFL